MSNTVARIVTRNVAPRYPVELEELCPLCRFVGNLDNLDVYYCERRHEVIRRGRCTAEAFSVKLAEPGDWLSFARAAWASRRPPHAYVTVKV